MSTKRDYYQHEALDRLHVVLAMIDDHLLSHPYIDTRPKLRQLVKSASKRLSKAYTKVAEQKELKP